MPAEAIDKTKLLIAQVKKETNTAEAINLLADILLESQEATIKSMDKLQVEIEKVSKVLLGNGHPEGSMCTRLQGLEKKVNWLFGVLGAVGLSVLIYFVTEVIKSI